MHIREEKFAGEAIEYWMPARRETVRVTKRGGDAEPEKDLVSDSAANHKEVPL